MSCMGLNESAIEEQRIYYAKMLSATYQAYMPFHIFVYQFLCLAGVFANISIIVVLLRPTMRKNPFNTFLIAIAICDMTLMASYFIYKQVEICHPWYFSYFWIVFTYFYAILSVFIHSISLWLTVNMAILRYLVLKRSSSSHSTIPSVNNFTAAFIAVITAIALSLFGAMPNMLRYEIRDGGFLDAPSFCLDNSSDYAHYYSEDSKVHAYNIAQPSWWNCRWERLNFWLAGLVLKLIPCFLLTVFMTLLVRVIIEARDRRTRLSIGSRRKSQNERTTSMLTAIVAVFLITELPQGLIVFATGVKPGVRYAMQYIGDFIDLLSLINSSFNFILCTLMSNVFRHEFLLTFGFCCSKSGENIREVKEDRRKIKFRAILPSRNGFVQLSSKYHEERCDQNTTDV